MHASRLLHKRKGSSSGSGNGSDSDTYPQTKALFGCELQFTSPDRCLLSDTCSDQGSQTDTHVQHCRLRHACTPPWANSRRGLGDRREHLGTPRVCTRGEGRAPTRAAKFVMAELAAGWKRCDPFRATGANHASSSAPSSPASGRYAAAPVSLRSTARPGGLPWGVDARHA